MSSTDRNFLRPEKKRFISAVKENEKEWWHVYKIYSMCVADAKKLTSIKTIDESFVKGPIRTFIVNWGNMGRVLGREDYKNWYDKLSKILKKHSNNLEGFRAKSLEHENIQNLQENITTIYSDIRSIVGPTSASKVLHLMCPDFFPIWDMNIRKKAGQDNGMKSGLNDKESGYFEFMKSVKSFLSEYVKEINQLKGNSNKSKLHYVDQYMWSVANKK